MKDLQVGDTDARGRVVKAIEWKVKHQTKGVCWGETYAYASFGWSVGIAERWASEASARGTLCRDDWKPVRVVTWSGPRCALPLRLVEESFISAGTAPGLAEWRFARVIAPGRNFLIRVYEVMG